MILRALTVTPDRDGLGYERADYLGDGSALLRKTSRVARTEAQPDFVESRRRGLHRQFGNRRTGKRYTSVKNRGGELKLLHLTKKCTICCKSPSSILFSTCIPTSR